MITHIFSKRVLWITFIIGLAPMLTGCPQGLPTAAFTADITGGAAPLTVQFTDNSSPGDKPITEWLWDFGDGETSNLASPQHTYSSSGAHTVSLKVTTSVGSDTLTKPDYITVNDSAEFFVTPNPAYVSEGSTLKLNAPDGGSALEWTSSDESIATVASDGTITGVNASETPATITVRRTNTDEVAYAAVYVVRVDISYSYQPLVLNISRQSYEQLAVSSTLSADTSFTWSSSNEDVVAVSDFGTILAVSQGSATVSVRGDFSGISNSVEVNVLADRPNFLIWDGEESINSITYGSLNSEEAFRGSGCLEGLTDQWHICSVTLNSTWRKDISGYDEVWLFAKVSEEGDSIEFKVSGWPYTSNTLTSGPLTTTYQLVKFPLADLQTDTFLLDSIEKLQFNLASADGVKKLYIDDVWAVSLDAFPPDTVPLMGAIEPISFGDVAVHETVTKEVAITNIGSGTLSVMDISLEGNHIHEFDVSSEPFSIEPGATHNLSVTFEPQAVLSKSTGDKSVTLMLGHNLTPMGSMTPVPLYGRAISPAISSSTQLLDFGSVPNNASASLKLSIGNPGNGTLHVFSASTSDPAFQVTPPSFDLVPDENQEVTVTFTASEDRTYSEALNFMSDSVDSEKLTVGLFASGLSASTSSALAIAKESITSSTVELSWPLLDSADSVKVYFGPEPSTTTGTDLPLQVLLDTISGNLTTYTVEGLAPAADAFFHIEVIDATDTVIAEGNAHARTVGGPLAELDNPIREIHMVAPDIMQVIVANDKVHSWTESGDVNDGGINRIVGDVGEELQTASWTITRNDGSTIGISQIYRQTTISGTPYYETGMDEGFSSTRTTGGLRLNLLDLDHLLYFMLDEPVGSRDILTVNGPEITRETMSFDHEIGSETFQTDFILPYSDRYLETSVIQLNQVGYNPRATERYAYVSGWMGDGGALSLSSFPAEAAVLIDNEDTLLKRTEVVSNLSIRVRSSMDADSGTEVKEIDLASVPADEGVVYRVYIPGVGVSYPTQISETAAFKAFYVTLRGLYHNRWGRDLQPQWTEWSSRPPDHPTVFTADTGDFVEERNAFDPSMPREGLRALRGGHHDAADFDIRGQHFLVAMYLMRVYEMHPEVFLDGQLTIPESGNGIPDLLDEVLWSLAAWEQLQEADGGVRGGVESFAHPALINFADLDQLPYWTYSKSAPHSMRVAGLFAQASRLVEDFDPAKAEELSMRAIAAYDYAMSNGVSETTKGPPMYGAGELYRLTSEQSYRDVFDSIWSANDPWGIGPSIYGFMPWASSFTLESQPILGDYVFGYLLSPNANPVFLEQAYDRFTSDADDVLDTIATACAHRSARVEGDNPNYGRGTVVGEHVMRIYSRFMLGDMTEEEEQSYFNAISLSADYVLGCNALGRVWLTGLGSRPPTSHMHNDSQTFRRLGMDFIPGIPVVGPRNSLSGTSSYDFGRRLLYPAFEELPLMRRYADVGSWGGTNEFTVWETQTPHAALFAALLGPEMMPPASWLPGGAEHRNPLAPREDATAK